jgi:hypothetical protein
MFATLPRSVQKRVAVVDLPEMLGGVCTHTGTIPSKTFREAVLFLTGYRERGFTSKGALPKHEYTAQAILERVRKVERWETDILRDQFTRNRVKSINGKGRFLVLLFQLFLFVFLATSTYLSLSTSIDFVFCLWGRTLTTSKFPPTVSVQGQACRVRMSCGQITFWYIFIQSL